MEQSGLFEQPDAIEQLGLRGRRGFVDGLVQPSPSTKISGQRTGLRVFSRSSPSTEISGQRIRPRGASRLHPDSKVPAAIEKKAVVF